MSVDPLADDYAGWSPYNYALNNPLNFFDPRGRCPVGVKTGKSFQDDEYGPDPVVCLSAEGVTVEGADESDKFEVEEVSLFTRLFGNLVDYEYEYADGQWYRYRERDAPRVITGMPPDVGLGAFGAPLRLGRALLGWRSPASGRRVISAWNKATFRSVAESIRYHFRRHVLARGLNKTVKEYTDDAVRFFHDNKARGQAITLNDGTPGIRIRTPGGGPGGIYTSAGKIVSFWYK